MGKQLVSRLMVIIGTRPEAIKMAPVIHELSCRSQCCSVDVITTGQHRELLWQVLEMFSISPLINLDLMQQNQSPSDILSSMLASLSPLLRERSPDVVLVHGDTMTTVAASLAAFYLKIPVAHIEAGLRTYDLKSPFPEEFNRQIVSKVARWHFAPTARAGQNLLNEGIDKTQIFITGNTVVDALNLTLKRLEDSDDLRSAVFCELEEVLGVNWLSKPYILVTCHRRENFGSKFTEICSAIKRLSELETEYNVFFMIHPNPNVKTVAENFFGDKSNVKLICPLEYASFCSLVKNSSLILTDSGGLQEEAASIGKQVLVLRDSTERPEAIEHGLAMLVGSDGGKIVDEAVLLLRDPERNIRRHAEGSPFGEGHASTIIADVLV